LRPFPLLVVLLLILGAQASSPAQAKGLPSVYVFGDYRSASSFFLAMKPGDRIVISEDIPSTVEQLKKMGFPAKIGSSKAISVEINPHDLAYILLYSKENGLRMTDLGSLLERSTLISRELSSRESEVAVLFYSSDGPDYSLLAAYAAFLKKAKLIDLDSIQPSRDVLDGVRHVILLTKPLTSTNYKRYQDVVDSLISLDDDPYLDASLGILTGSDVAIPFLMLLSNDAASRGLIHKLRGISLVEDLPLARKVEFIAQSYGLNAKILHPDVKYSNLTKDDSIEILKDARNSIIYLNLHGNPYVMALRTEGNVILTPSIVRSAEPLASVVITLSCDTLRFPEIRDPKSSIAYSFLGAGAFAYIGATRIEFSIGSEAGTSFPDLILMMALTGHTLGEAVMVVNNLHIKESLEKGISPRQAAYEVLLGDPTLSLSSHDLPYRTGGDHGVYEVSILGTTPVIYLQLPVPRESDLLPNVEADLPSIYFKWYRDERGLFIYVSTLSSSFSGYFREDTDVRIELRGRYGYLEYVPYLAIILVTVLSLVVLIRARRHA